MRAGSSTLSSGAMPAKRLMVRERSDGLYMKLTTPANSDTSLCSPFAPCSHYARVHESPPRIRPSFLGPRQGLVEQEARNPFQRVEVNGRRQRFRKARGGLQEHLHVHPQLQHRRRGRYELGRQEDGCEEGEECSLWAACVRLCFCVSNSSKFHIAYRTSRTTTNTRP